MKKSRIFMAAGAVVLAISAVFATKANKHFHGYNAAASPTGNYEFRVTGLTANIFTTLSNSALKVYAQLVTANGDLKVSSPVQLYTDISVKVPLIYN
jgi:hypothetical protein